MTLTKKQKNFLIHISNQNVTFERNKFYNIHHIENKTISAFITWLKDASHTCNLKNYAPESAIVDSVISKCTSNRLRHQLLCEPKLDLIKFWSTSKKVVHCYSCGSNTHTHGSTNCPAKGKFCNYCKKPNHFASVCFKNKPKTEPTNDEQNKTIQQIIWEPDSEDDYCFNINQPKPNVIDSDTFDQLAQSKNIYLEQSAACVYVYNLRNPLELGGLFFSAVSVGNNKLIAKFLVSKGKSSGCLLGWSTATKLGVLQIHQVNEIHIPNDSKKVSTILNNFLEVTLGLGKLKNNQVKLNIDNTLKPVSQHLRWVPFHIQKKTESKIGELLKLDIIEPVSEASPWVSPLLAVPKPKTVDVRIVIDM